MWWIPPGRELPGQLELAAPRRIATDGHRALALATGTLVDLQTGKEIALPRGDLLRAGFLEGRPVLWTATSDGILQFWHSVNGTLLLTLYSFTDNRFFALTPDGRYDTNLTPDANEVRWLMADAPWQSLAAQTFMRDYYEPRLLPRMLACTAANNCSGEFRSLPPVDEINRVLPQVDVSSVTPGAAKGTVDVCVAARSMAAETGAGQDRPWGCITCGCSATASSWPSVARRRGTWTRRTSTSGVQKLPFQTRPARKPAAPSPSPFPSTAGQ